MLRYLVVLMLLAGCASAPEIDPNLEAALTAEAKAYSAMLQAKMDRGEMSPEEAKYLYTRKVNELTDRAAAHVPSPRTVTPQTTQCHADGYGGVRCTTR